MADPSWTWVSPGEVPSPRWDRVRGAARGWRELWAGHWGAGGHEHVPLGRLCCGKAASYQGGWTGGAAAPKATLGRSARAPQLETWLQRPCAVDHPKALLLPAVRRQSYGKHMKEVRETALL